MKRLRTLGLSSEYGEGKALRIGEWWFGLTVDSQPPFFQVTFEVFPDDHPSAEKVWSQPTTEEELEEYWAGREDYDYLD